MKLVAKEGNIDKAEDLCNMLMKDWKIETEVKTQTDMAKEAFNNKKNHFVVAWIWIREKRLLKFYV